MQGFDAFPATVYAAIHNLINHPKMAYYGVGEPVRSFPNSECEVTKYF